VNRDKRKSLSSLVTVHGLRFTFFLHFPEHEVFQKRVVGGEARDGEAGETVAEAAFEDEAADKGRRGGRGDA
jgi:hypothetical protein